MSRSRSRSCSTQSRVIRSPSWGRREQSESLCRRWPSYDGSFCSTIDIAERVSGQNYDTHRKGITASLNFMSNPELCCVVLEESGEVLCCPPVEYIKTWSTVMYHSVDAGRFRVEFRDGKRQVQISRDFEPVVVDAFFKYIYTWGNMVEVLETLESQAHAPSKPGGGLAARPYRLMPEGLDQKWLQLVQMAEYYDVQDLTLAALKFVALDKDVMDNMGVSLDRLLHTHTKAQLYVAGYSCSEILERCGCCVNNDVDLIAGCLLHDIVSVRELLIKYGPRQVILANVRSWTPWREEVFKKAKKFADDNNVKCVDLFIGEAIGLDSNGLKDIGYALCDLVREVSPQRLQELGFRPHRIAACVRRMRTHEPSNVQGVS